MSRSAPRTHPYLARIFNLDQTVTERIMWSSMASAAFTRLRPQLAAGAVRVEIGVKSDDRFMVILDRSLTR